MNARERGFVEHVWRHYEAAGRHHLPWRHTKDPYKILVSEVMLQQTQISRVVQKYNDFIVLFPTARALAEAPLRAVLIAWQGLGYNRRAKALHAAAVAVVSSNKRFPKTYDDLIALPGVGHYTAGAVLAFAYGSAVPVLETNIRTVYLHHFFKNKTDISDAELFRLVQKTLDQSRPREWYYALMDYGAHLKSTIGNQNDRSRNFVTQAPFRGSEREIRGAIIKLLTFRSKSIARKTILSELKRFTDSRVDAQLERLIEEGMVVRSRGLYSLPT